MQSFLSNTNKIFNHTQKKNTSTIFMFPIYCHEYKKEIKTHTHKIVNKNNYMKIIKREIKNDKHIISIYTEKNPSNSM